MKILFCVQSDIFWHRNPLVMLVVQFQFSRALLRWSALECGLALRRDSVQIVFRGSAFIVSNINNFQIKCSLPWVCFFVLSSYFVNLVKYIVTLLKSTCFFPWRMCPWTVRFCRPPPVQLPLSLWQRQKQQEVAPGSCSRGMSSPKWVHWGSRATLCSVSLWWDNILPCSWKALPDHTPAPVQICSAQSKLTRFSKGSLRDDVIAGIMLTCQALEAFSAAPAAQPCILTRVKWHCLGGSWVSEACSVENKSCLIQLYVHLAAKIT